MILQHSLVARVVIALAALTFGLSSIAQADSLYYKIGSGSTVNAYDPPNSDNGLEIHTELKPNLDDIDFWLDDGEWESFAFFDIWTPESWVNGDDLNGKSIAATLEFDVPDSSATVSGETFGVSLYGVLQWGEVMWGAPAIVTTADRTFMVKLSDGTFNPGYFGLTGGPGCGTTIFAKVKQINSSEITTVPTPSAALGGLALLGLQLVRRRRA